MWWRRNHLLGGLALALIVGLVVPAPGLQTAEAQTTEIGAAVETEPVPSSGDAADDPAIWIHPTDPSLSTVIGTDKEGGLAVYDLDGNELQYISGFRPNNTDVLHNFPMGGQSVDLVLSSNDEGNVISFHRVDVATRRLVPAGPSVETDMSVYGICTYRSQSGYYVFVTPEDGGVVKQWVLTDNGAGGVDAGLVRELPVDSITEGCAADEERGYLYIAEETVGIWKYGAEPEAGTTRVSVDTVGARLDDDIEGLTIYYGPDRTGYLIASSQGSDEFVVYDRADDNPYITRFTITSSGSIDGVTGTDGIAVTAVPLDSTFPAGLFVVQDGDNEPENQNFKLVSWAVIASSVSPSLIAEAGPDPRGELVAPIDVMPPEPARTWTLIETAATAGDAAGGDHPLEVGQGETVLRFEDLDIAPGSLVRNAHIQFSAVGSTSEPVALTLTAAGENGQTASLAATWAPAPWDDESRGPYQRTVDLSGLIQQVVDSETWETGSTLTIVIEGEGGGSRTAVAASGPGGPSLRMEYAPDA